jgi:hypothetical protein
MKTRINVLESIDKDELDKLGQVVKETLALKYSDKKRTFSSVDLWNIHRQKKNIPSRRELA